jgi:hypothetical protein
LADFGAGSVAHTTGYRYLVRVCVCVPDVRSDIVPLACRAREFRFEVRGRTFVTSHMRLPKSSDRAGA